MGTLHELKKKNGYYSQSALASNLAAEVAARPAERQQPQQNPQGSVTTNYEVPVCYAHRNASIYLCAATAIAVIASFGTLFAVKAIQLNDTKETISKATNYRTQSSRELVLGSQTEAKTLSAEHVSALAAKHGMIHPDDTNDVDLKKSQDVADKGE